MDVEGEWREDTGCVSCGDSSDALHHEWIKKCDFI
jgi:hypothetical protein